MIVSTVQVTLAGVASRLPAPSTARARKVCWPSSRAESGMETFALHAVNVAPSRLHWNVALASEEIVKAAGTLLMGSGCALNVVSGASVSTVQVKLAGVASVLPIVSVAATVNVCWPSARPETVKGLVQAELVPSTVQRNVAGVFVDENVNWSDVWFVSVAGVWSRFVSGTVVW